MQKNLGSWDIFCTVVDNFGDIGVTWRLARQLVREHGLRVHLWVDDLSAFSKICPEVLEKVAVQSIQGVEVCLWSDPWQPASRPFAHVVIEAFGCSLPEAYLQSMQRQSSLGQSVLWLNLEYLTAEPWAADCHGLPSLQAGGLKKLFFFPGFSSETGGLLRERHLIEQRRLLQKNSHLKAAFLRQIGIDCPQDTRLISLFAYENFAVEGLLSELSKSPTPVRLLIPESKVLGSIERSVGQSLKTGALHQLGNVQIQVLPFMDMDCYDQLLWCCDLNMVRGEDSFVRAQWAGRPFIWHIYPQDEDAHWTKLKAFFECYVQDLAIEDAAVLYQAWEGWNAGKFAQFGCILKLLERLDVLTQHAERWASLQASQQDLAGKLVSFHSDWL